MKIVDMWIFFYKFSHHHCKVETFSNFWHFYYLLWLLLMCKYSRRKTC